jgi:hypothetical protein
MEEIEEAISQLYGRVDSADDFRHRVNEILMPAGGVAAPHIYQCPSCGRLAIFARACDNDVVQWYAPDTHEEAGPPSRLASVYDTPPEPWQQERLRGQKGD